MLTVKVFVLVFVLVFVIVKIVVIFGIEIACRVSKLHFDILVLDHHCHIILIVMLDYGDELLFRFFYIRQLSERSIKVLAIADVQETLDVLVLSIQTADFEATMLRVVGNLPAEPHASRRSLPQLILACAQAEARAIRNLRALLIVLEPYLTTFATEEHLAFAILDNHDRLGDVRIAIISVHVYSYHSIRFFVFFRFRLLCFSNTMQS